MRRRLTFIHDEKTDFDPKSIQINPGSFFIPELKSAREEQLKFSLDELPEEIQQLLVNSQELHIRWAPEHRFDTIAPYLSRISPGLHVFYTPTDTETDDLLCPGIRKAFSPDLKCSSPNTTFIRPSVVDSEFNTTPALQYHSLLPHLDHLVSYLQRTVCPHSSLSCIHSTSLLSTADAVDASWSAITSILTISAFWAHPPASLIDPTSGHKTKNAWSIFIEDSPGSSQSRVEVGILSPEPAGSDPQDLTLSGFLTVLGSDTQPKPTRFSFPSRHLALPPSERQTYYAAILQPQGLHPTLQITFPASANLTPPVNLPHSSQCMLQAHLTLPSHTFVDPYALKPTEPSFVSTYHITAIHSHTGHLDLEAPDYLPSTPWGSTLLFRLLLPPPTHPASEPWHVTLPLHLRYLPPSAQSHLPATLPYPLLYWACPADADAAAKFSINPFDRVHLGYDGAYGPLTTFFHLDPVAAPPPSSSPPPPSSTTPNPSSNSSINSSSNNNKLTIPLQIPVLNTDTSPLASPLAVEVVTLLTIVAGFLWVFAKLWPALKAELRAYIPDTVETSQPLSGEWAEPVKGGVGTGDGVERRRRRGGGG